MLEGETEVVEITGRKFSSGFSGDPDDDKMEEDLINGNAAAKAETQNRESQAEEASMDIVGVDASPDLEAMVTDEVVKRGLEPVGEDSCPQGCSQRISNLVVVSVEA